MTVVVKPYISVLSCIDIFQFVRYSGSAYAGDIRLMCAFLGDIRELFDKYTNLLLFAVLRRQTKVYHSQLTLRK